MKKLDIEQAEPIRKKFAPDWEIRKGTYLYKKVAFNDYNQVLRFLMAIEQPQIKLDHFADFMNFYNELTIAITTHDVKGLTQLDFELALYIDKALEQMDARQLEEDVIKATKEDFLAFKKFVKGTTHLLKNYNNMSEEEQDELLADLVKLQFDSNLMNSFPKWKEYAIKTMKDLDDERIQKVFKQAGIAEGRIRENFADGKKKGKSRPGRVKKAGASCKGSVTSLRKKAAKYSGEKGKMYHWCANMKSGKKK